MNARRRLLHYASGVASIVALGAAILVPGSAAQAPNPISAAAIRAGTCEAPGEVVAPLRDLVGPERGLRSGAPSALPVFSSESEVDIPLQALLASPHAITIGRPGDDGSVLACGAIGGVVTDGEELVLGLGQRGNAGYGGIARLEADDHGTEITVYLAGPTAAIATPGTRATPSVASRAVEIKGFAYIPPTVDVPVGGSVTWTNADNAPHTVTGVDGAIPQSKGLGFGQSFTQTFDTPGSYHYYCAYHPGMKGTVIVK